MPRDPKAPGFMRELDKTISKPRRRKPGRRRVK